MSKESNLVCDFCGKSGFERREGSHWGEDKVKESTVKDWADVQVWFGEKEEEDIEKDACKECAVKVREAIYALIQV